MRALILTFLLGNCSQAIAACTNLETANYVNGRVSEIAGGRPSFSGPSPKNMYLPLSFDSSRVNFSSAAEKGFAGPGSQDQSLD